MADLKRSAKKVVNTALLIVSVAVAAYLYWRRPSYRFWRLVAMHPDEAFEAFRDSPHWQITYQGSIEEERLRKDGGWSGPYTFFVPKLKTEVRVFGHRPAYLEFEKRALEARCLPKQ